MQLKKLKKKKIYTVKNLEIERKQQTIQQHWTHRKRISSENVLTPLKTDSPAPHSQQQIGPRNIHGFFHAH